jgi:hypothetical protein
MASSVIVWITRDDYPAFRRLFPSETEFLIPYDAWEQFTRKKIAELEAVGNIVRTAVIHPEHYTKWCDAAGVNYNGASLSTFADITDRQEREHGT